MSWRFKLTFMICLFLQLGTGYAGTSAAEQFKIGNSLYNQENYDSAFSYYETLIDEGNFSFELFFNAGNTAYQLHKTGKTVLYLEKAKKLSPTNEDVLHNLKLAYRTLVDKNIASDDSKASERIMSILSRSPNYWSWGAILMCVLGVVFLILYKMSTSKRNKVVGFILGISALVLSAICLTLSIVQFNYLENHSDGVIMNQSVTLRNAPNEESENAFILHEGTKVELKSISGDWFEVVYTDGKIGWVNTADIEVIRFRTFFPM